MWLGILFEYGGGAKHHEGGGGLSIGEGCIGGGVGVGVGTGVRDRGRLLGLGLSSIVDALTAFNLC